MAFFAYKARNARGEMLQGVLEGMDSGSVADQLFNTGVTPVDIIATTKPAGNDTITATLVSTARSCYDSVVSGARVVGDPSLGAGMVTVSHEEAITLWPNPAGDVLHISCAATVTSVVITNTLGQQVYSGSTTTADVSGLVAGVYFVRVNGVMGGRFLKK